MTAGLLAIVLSCPPTRFVKIYYLHLVCKLTVYYVSWPYGWSYAAGHIKTLIAWSYNLYFTVFQGKLLLAIINLLSTIPRSAFQNLNFRKNIAFLSNSCILVF